MTDSRDIPLEDFRRAGIRAIDWVASFLADPERYPVLPQVEPGALKAALPEGPPTEGESIDAILMINVLHHIKNPQGFLEEAQRCLRPGGRVVMIDILEKRLVIGGFPLGGSFFFTSQEMIEFLKQVNMDFKLRTEKERLDLIKYVGNLDLDKLGVK